MIPRTLARTLTGATFALAFLSTGCGGDRLTAPASRPLVARSDAPPTSSTTVLLPVIKRTTPLAQDIVVSQTIGPAGGVIDIPAAGLHVVFPAGALSQTTTITATAYAGQYVSYGFAPHGITFSVPVIVRQALAGTSGTVDLSSPLVGGYLLNGPSDIEEDGEAEISEVLPAATTVTSSGGLLDPYTQFPIHHFSGYIIATGRTSVAPEGN